MQDFELYQDINARTGGEIYIGVVGPVRTGKSTFIRHFAEQMILPELQGNELETTRDELPTSGIGKMITTTEPKFVPSKAAVLHLDNDISVKCRMVDCIGYIVPGAEGYTDEDHEPRMVHTPWNEHEIPFSEAAETGTNRVIHDHATLGLLITCDGSFGNIPRENFIDAEKQAVFTLQKTGKPFLVLVNSSRPYDDAARRTVQFIETTYHAACMAVNCEQLSKQDIKQILEQLLYEFPAARLEYDIPKWMETLPSDHWIKQELLTEIRKVMKRIKTIRDVTPDAVSMNKPFIRKMKLDHIDLSSGRIELSLEPVELYYYQMLSDITGMSIQSDYQLITILKELSALRSSYQAAAAAIEEVKKTGYGVLTPQKEETEINEPVIMKQGTRYGVRIVTKSPTIHLIRADIETEIAPIVGSEEQAVDLIRYIQTASANEDGIWNVSILGKSMQQLVQTGIESKLALIDDDSRQKLRQAMKKVVNETSGGIICLII